MTIVRHAYPMVLLVALGCGATPKPLAREITRTPLTAEAQDKHAQLVAEGDALWLERGDEAKLRQAIAKWDEAVQVKPDAHAIYAKLTRACYLLADGFLSFDQDRSEEFMATHEKGVAYAEQGMMALSPEYEKKRRAGAKLEDAAKTLGKEAVPLLYWYDVNLGKWAKHQGISTTLKYKERIFKTMQRVQELDPEYFFGAPDRYFGAYYALAPSFAGGDLDKSRQYFDASLSKAKNYLATHVLVADTYATKVQDRDLYERELRLVLETPADSIPELVPEQMIEKKKAEKLLKEIDEKF
ncbi:MAG: hypothetical protein HY698_05310 [Deltaproteobacteria bacterium]|nr:hypothetical protein [Deltaproteobacteria bacterium]